MAFVQGLEPEKRNARQHILATAVELVAMYNTHNLIFNYDKLSAADKPCFPFTAHECCLTCNSGIYCVAETRKIGKACNLKTRCAQYREDNLTVYKVLDLHSIPETVVGEHDFIMRACREGVGEAIRLWGTTMGYDPARRPRQALAGELPLTTQFVLSTMIPDGVYCSVHLPGMLQAIRSCLAESGIQQWLHTVPLDSDVHEMLSTGDIFSKFEVGARAWIYIYIYIYM